MGEAAKPAPLPVVVKIGGSLAETGRLTDVLALVSCANRDIVIVPGGGGFAQKVRDLQNALKFDDASAHRLAILGMHQMADIYLAMERRLGAADSLEAIARQQTLNLIPVWLPFQMCENDSDIPTNWTITSDGLAARLAERLGGAPLVLVKSVDVPRDATASDLAREGVVDEAFPVIVARANLDWRIFGPSDDKALMAYLDIGPVKCGPMTGEES